MAKLNLNKKKFILDKLVINFVFSYAIENENIQSLWLHLSLAQHLGVRDEQSYRNNRYEGLTSIRLDVLNKTSLPLNLDRLMHWHHWIFREDYQIAFD